MRTGLPRGPAARRAVGRCEDLVQRRAARTGAREGRVERWAAVERVGLRPGDGSEDGHRLPGRALEPLGREVDGEEPELGAVARRPLVRVHEGPVVVAAHGESIAPRRGDSVDGLLQRELPLDVVGIVIPRAMLGHPHGQALREPVGLTDARVERTRVLVPLHGDKRRGQAPLRLQVGARRAEGEHGHGDEGVGVDAYEVCMLREIGREREELVHDKREDAHRPAVDEVPMATRRHAHQEHGEAHLARHAVPVGVDSVDLVEQRVGAAVRVDETDQHLPPLAQMAAAPRCPAAGGVAEHGLDEGLVLGEPHVHDVTQVARHVRDKAKPRVTRALVRPATLRRDPLWLLVVEQPDDGLDTRRLQLDTPVAVAGEGHLVVVLALFEV
mmetsp:Transcript_18001/g.42868  ORF Transcript_18001/g.42868 Transcript_18001/m.42868 type:complete len:385 (+) Transcript_18001:229-1383(+)